jgi:hypothetical protein
VVEEPGGPCRCAAGNELRHAAAKWGEGGAMLPEGDSAMVAELLLAARGFRSLGPYWRSSRPSVVLIDDEV